MSISTPTVETPPDYFELIEPGFSDPRDPDRPSRLCLCVSDLHFTDGTVGNQSADAVVWYRVFKNIADMCVDSQAEELTLVLVGDVVDMIRTAKWSEQGVYPWQREDPKFKEILRSTMRDIIELHARPATGDKPPGFFHLLKNLPERLKEYHSNGATSRIKHCRTIVLLGNHDKEILADDVSLKMFYEECLGQSVDNHSETRLSDAYRRWVGNVYFNDSEKYLSDPQRGDAPWLPFYWGDPGFRLFVTHGQWRDQANSRRIVGKGAEYSWDVKDGWQLKRWQNIRFAPFTQACFGDTVAAGVLSGFIARGKQKLTAVSADTDKVQKLIVRLQRILDELDLYRPTFTAIQRILIETRKLSRKDPKLASIRSILETELIRSLREWVAWDFTYVSASPPVALAMRIAKPVLWIMKWFGIKIELGSLYSLLKLVNWYQQRHRESDAPSFDTMRGFPGFLADYRRYGFHIHGEGHTHIPLQEEVDFDDPPNTVSRGNYTYVNFGTWRDRVLPKKKRGYRRHGMGRILVVLDTAPKTPEASRGYSYWTQDLLTWGDDSDHLN